MGCEELLFPWYTEFATDLGQLVDFQLIKDGACNILIPEAGLIRNERLNV